MEDDPLQRLAEDFDREFSNAHGVALGEGIIDDLFRPWVSEWMGAAGGDGDATAFTMTLNGEAALLFLSEDGLRIITATRSSGGDAPPELQTRYLPPLPGEYEERLQNVGGQYQLDLHFRHKTLGPDGLHLRVESMSRITAPRTQLIRSILRGWAQRARQV